jgi:hypothetical protein
MLLSSIFVIERLLYNSIYYATGRLLLHACSILYTNGKLSSLIPQHFVRHEKEAFFNTVAFYMPLEGCFLQSCRILYVTEK